MDNKLMKKYISNEIDRQFNEVELEKEKRKTILICLDIFSNNLNNLNNIDENNNIIKDINEIKKILEKSEYNISKRKKLLNYLKKNNIESYNTNYEKFSETIYSNAAAIDQFIYKYLSMSLENYKMAPLSLTEETVTTEEENNNTDDVVDIEDNDILLISDKDQLVYLPYKKEEIIEHQQSSPSSNINEIIKTFYTVPLSKFKYPAIARFREVFNLARKSSKSVPEAFSLSLELYLENRLNPAVIVACKNFDELDIYLDYLESNELDKFDIFKIVFESAPIVKK